VTRNRRQRSRVHGPLDLGDRRQAVAVIGGDRDLVRVDDLQVSLDQPEHVEVQEKTLRCMQAAERRGHSLRHLLRLQRLRRHGSPLDELEHHHIEVGNDLEHARADPGRGRRLGVEHLVDAIDGQELGGLPGHSNHIPHAVRLDEVVLVGEATRKWRYLHRLALPERDERYRVVSS